MRRILAEDLYNDTYGRLRLFEAIKLRHKNDSKFRIPSPRAVYQFMKILRLRHYPRRNPHGITKVDRKARESENLLKRDFYSEKSLEKCINDISEIKACDGKLYVSVVFDYFDASALAISLDTNMKATLTKSTLDKVYMSYPDLRGAIIHSDRGSQYTSELYRNTIKKYGIIQSMNSAGGI